VLDTWPFLRPACLADLKNRLLEFFAPPSSSVTPGRFVYSHRVCVSFTTIKKLRSTRDLNWLNPSVPSPFSFLRVPQPPDRVSSADFSLLFVGHVMLEYSPFTLSPEAFLFEFKTLLVSSCPPRPDYSDSLNSPVNPRSAKFRIVDIFS